MAETKKILYIGEFPPPVGGVTIKNELIRKHILDGAETEYFDLYRCKKNLLLVCILAFHICEARFRYKQIIIGVGANRRRLLLLLLIRCLAGKRMLGCTDIIMMGNTFQMYCSNNKLCKKLVKQIRYVFPESMKMCAEFRAIGISNTKVLPNCRDIEEAISPKRRDTNEPIKLVFFSRISREKGVPVLFDMCKILNEKKSNYILDFYGIIAPDYEVEFKASLQQLQQCSNKGVFDATNENVFAKLGEYDILLFPTKWVSEGLAGIIIESKIAGIPAVVSDHNYNCEMVIDSVEGVVISEHSHIAYAEAIGSLQADAEKLYKLAVGAFESRQRYDIKNFSEIFR